MASTYSQLEPDGTPTRWIGKTPLPYLSPEDFCRDDRIEELSWEEYLFDQLTKIYLRVLGIGLFVAADMAVSMPAPHHPRRCLTPQLISHQPKFGTPDGGSQWHPHSYMERFVNGHQV